MLKKLEETRIAIVDDHALFADGLKALLESKTKIGYCSIFTSGKEAIQEIPLEKPDIVLLDIHLPDANGIQLAEELKTRLPNLKVLILTMDASKEFLIQAISAGVNGYLLKTAPFSKITSCIEAALEGDMVFAEEVSGMLLEEFKKNLPTPKKTSPLLEQLSKREKQILTLVAQGKDNQSIARELFISEKTVKNYVS
ncbi:MAG: response regulator transcription factor, partial [Candidatus Atribacteria bacterium]|nr:response regulator transcription factor [Candidatus Atribacteria bacterium]MCD6350310.1 response regulator transcription factor [Candidatus Atribacteria bacterium]